MMLGLLVFLLVAHVAAFVVFAIAVTEIHRWREWHHVYLGHALGIIGWALASWGATTGHAWAFGLGVALMVLGAWIAWDDALSHARQARDPDFPRSGPRGHLDRETSWWHRFAHRRGVI